MMGQDHTESIGPKSKPMIDTCVCGKDSHVGHAENDDNSKQAPC